MARTSMNTKSAGGKNQKCALYKLEVELLQGPITEAFARENPQVSRTIEMRGDQTLNALHDAIFRPFDRFDEHMYEFQIGGNGPMDPKARRYVLPMAVDDPFEDLQSAGDVTRTTMGDLDLTIGEPFGYWFDFGDDWWHQITLIAIHDKVPRGRYPKITKRTGDSPPQYIEWDDEDYDADG